MASNPVMWRRAAVTAFATAAAGTAINQPRNLHAEAPQDEPTSLSWRTRMSQAHVRKSIYDDEPLPSPNSSTVTPSTVDTKAISESSTSTPPPEAQSPSPLASPTERLAQQIRNLRLTLHSGAVKTEDTLNDTLTHSLNLEKSFTSTITSLAPSAQSGEKLMPNGLYVLVSIMGSQILCRNRSFPIRFAFPVLVGLGTAQYMIPNTMKNVGDLAWRYEKRYPQVAEMHEAVVDRTRRFLETGKEHSKMSVDMLEGKVGEVRESIEGWVRRGK